MCIDRRGSLSGIVEFSVSFTVGGGMTNCSEITDCSEMANYSEVADCGEVADCSGVAGILEKFKAACVCTFADSGTFNILGKYKFLC